MSKVAPTQKYGYVDIKQASRVRPRKLKTWKRRWVVLTKMSNLSNEEYLAKLDLYDSEAKWLVNSSDKVTFVLENVTCIQPVKSKTHKHAFEVIQGHPVLVISGATELDSYSWIVSLQQIFTPDNIQAKQDTYDVTVSENEDSRKWRLSGDYNLTVSATCLSLGSSEGTCVISWALNSLVRFNVEQRDVPGHRASLLIECGPKSATGHSFFNLLSDKAEDILGAIRQSICLALTLKQNIRMSSSTRHRSPSVTISERSFQRLLDSHSIVHHSSQSVAQHIPQSVAQHIPQSVAQHIPQSVAQHIPQSAPRPIPPARSESSSSASNFGSPGRSAHSPNSSLTTGHFSADFSSFLVMEENDEPHVHHLEPDLASTDATSCEKVKVCSHRRSSSHPENPYMGNNDYSEIKDISDEMKSVSRRNTISCEPADVDFDRLRSVSAVVASLKANSNFNNGNAASPSPQNKDDDKSDFDSAFSSMALSLTKDYLPRKDCPQTACAEGQCSCVLGRRRSSSTPDLQAYWKMNRFENVYEELGELAASVHRLNKKEESETPPLLPARPSSTTCTRTTQQNSTRKNKSLLKMHSFNENKGTTDRLCACDNVRVASWLVGDGQCPVCHCIETTDRSKTSLLEKSPKVKKADSLFSAINDINSIILQVQTVKRRRSSDITPVAASIVFTSSSDINYSQTTSQQWQRDNLAGSSKSMPTTPVNLIDLQENTDDFQSQQRASELLPMDARNNILDSLADFFLGDGDFCVTPVVTSQSSTQLLCHPAHLTKSRYSFTNIPASDKTKLSLSSRTSTWPGHNGRCDDTNPSFAQLTSQTKPMDIWGDDTGSSSESTDMAETLSQISGRLISRGPLV